MRRRPFSAKHRSPLANVLFVVWLVALSACRSPFASTPTPTPAPTPFCEALYPVVAVSSLLVQDRVVYAGAVDVPANQSYIYALSARTGILLWRYPISGYPTVDREPEVAAVAGGVVFAGAGTSVLALRASDGALLWSADTGRSDSPSLIVSSGVVYARGANKSGSSGSALFALQASDGKLLWQRTATAADNGPFSLPTVVGNVVYVYTGPVPWGGGISHASIYALRVSDGAVLWSHPWQSRLASAFAAPLVTDGVLYTSVRSTGSVYALRASDGAVLWHAQVDQGVISAPLVAGGLVYVIGAGMTGTGVDAGHTTLYALDARDGTQRWQRGAALLDGAADGLVYVEGPDPANASDGLFALDGASGAIHWVEHVDYGGVPVGPDAGVLYVEGGIDGGTAVQALNAATGHVIWQTPVAQSDRPFTHGSAGVYFAMGRYDPSPCTPQFKAGYLYALDARTGSFLWRFQTQGQSR